MKTATLAALLLASTFAAGSAAQTFRSTKQA